MTAEILLNYCVHLSVCRWEHKKRGKKKCTHFWQAEAISRSFPKLCIHLAKGSRRNGLKNHSILMGSFGGKDLVSTQVRIG